MSCADSYDRLRKVRICESRSNTQQGIKSTISSLIEHIFIPQCFT